MILLEKMNQEKSFSETEKNIIDYILKHQNQIADMTIHQLAQETYSSNATIIRMCQKLGFKGYRQFKIHFIQEVESTKYLADTVDFNTPFHGLENTDEMIYKMASLYKESIDLCLQRINSRDIDHICQTIMKSKRLFIYATGDTMITVKGFMNKLMKLNIYPILASENHEEHASSYNVTRDDCVLFMSYDLKSKQFLECLHILKTKGAPIITMTANVDSPITKMSHYRLLIARKETDYKIATFYSQFVFEFILNILYSTIYAYDYQKNHKHKKSIDMLK